MNIAPPPFFQHLLFEQPWTLVIVLLAVAAVLRLIAKSRNSRKINLSSQVIVLVAIGIIALSFLVQTPREKLIAKTKSLVKATAPLDMQTLQNNIKPNVPIVTKNHTVIGKFKEFEKAIVNHKIQEQSLSQVNAQVKSNKALSKFTATTRFSQAQIPVRSKWALTWQLGSDGNWQVTEIKWLKLNRHNPPNRIPAVR